MALVSTRGRYLLRVMLDLAEHGSGGYVPMKEVARRQAISLKYLERILPILTKNKLLETSPGKGGGYRLCRRPSDYSVGEILRLTEGNLAPVACLEGPANTCARAGSCRTLCMWQKFKNMADAFFDSVSIADLVAPEADSRQALPGS